MNNIYLDYAAATPLDDSVLEAMKPYFSDLFHNPSAIYLEGREAHKRLEQARADVAHWLGSRPEEIIFTSGATESDNLAIDGIMSRFKDKRLSISAIEHDAVLNAAKQYNYDIINVTDQGVVTENALKDSVSGDTVLVSIIYANNEIGTIQQMSQLADVIEDIRRQRAESGNDLPLYLHTDATQAANYLDLHINRLKVDIMTLNSAKIYGPKQVGCLYVRGGIEINPQLRGGGQERGLRSGTQNLAGAVGMAQALKLVQTDRKEESHRLGQMVAKAEKKLKQSIQDVEILGGKRRLPNNLCLLLPGLDGERAVMELDERGIQCSTGSACTALSDESSHVVKALGKSEREAAATLRLTLGRSTLETDFMTAVDTIIELYATHRHTTSV